MSGQSSLFERLRRRGLIAQCSDPTVITQIENGELTLYVGIDPTAASLHVGHLVPLMLLYWLVKAGNRAIIIIGDGTARVGDPSGREETRELLDQEHIASNATRITLQIQQLNRCMNVTTELVYNSAWLANLHYLDFLRDIGYHFSVNRMLSFESYRRRMERGLSFTEFNYQLLQSYDFLRLHQEYDCRLQIGGDDQWGNIVSGIDLIRRITRHECYGITTPLVTNAQGTKMGKTLAGAISLDANITSPYEFYQFWRNVDDRDLSAALLRYTMLDEHHLPPPDTDSATLNQSKERLAMEVTTLIHGAQQAQECRASSHTFFSTQSSDTVELPGSTLTRDRLQQGIDIIDLFMQSPFFRTRSEARRLIQQGGATINGRTIQDPTTVIYVKDASKGQFLLRAGKKRHWSVAIKN